MKYLTISIIVIVSCLATKANAQSDSVGFRKDFDIFKKVLEETHPSLYRFTSKEIFDATFNRIQSEISHEMTDLDFFRSLSTLQTLIREGHSRVIPSAYLINEFKGKKVFPLNVFVQNDRLIVVKGQTPEGESFEGTEIISINNKSIINIINDFSKSAGLISGFNNSYMLNRLSFNDSFSLAYYYFIHNSSDFLIEYVTETGDTLKQEVTGIKKNGMEATFPKWPNEPDPPIYYEIDNENGIAYLKITTFANWVVSYNKKKYLKIFMNFFQALEDKKVEHLIIDVRDNFGGDELIAVDLLTYFTNNKFTINKSIKLKTLDFSYVNELSGKNNLKYPEKDYLKTDSGYYKIDD